MRWLIVLGVVVLGAGGVAVWKSFAKDDPTAPGMPWGSNAIVGYGAEIPRGVTGSHVMIIPHIDINWLAAKVSRLQKELEALRSEVAALHTDAPEGEEVGGG